MNECGVAIGNEAVFTKEELPDEDLLRTAELHFEAALESARSGGAAFHPGPERTRP